MNEVAYGIHAVQALITHHPQRVEKLAVQTAGSNRLQTLIKLAQNQQITIEQLDKHNFEKSLPGPCRHQGVLAYYQSLNLAGENELQHDLQKLEHDPFILILDTIKDPHNFGACLRTAGAVGVDAVIYPKDKSVKLTSVVHHVSSGASFSIPIYQITNLARVMRALQGMGIWIYGTDAEAQQNLYEVDISGPMALVMGAEGEGLRHLTKQHCDHLMKIPMTDAIESLNVSVATGVCLFEVFRQRIGS